jgi:uncharacterized alpha/beta hydrolase family protein
VANPDDLAMGTCATKRINVVANDTDPNGNYPITLVSVTPGSLGTSSVYDTTTVQFHANGGAGRDSLTYTIRNSQGVTATGTLTVTVTDLGGCN